MSEKRKKILLVDDNEMIRIYFQDVFWIHGLEYKCDLLTAKNPEEAEKIISKKETCPDIVFLDLVMPQKKDNKTITSPQAGLGLIKKIKNNPWQKKIKIVVFSGYDDQELKNQAKETGADYYLVKGKNLPKELVEFTEKLLKE